MIREFKKGKSRFEKVQSLIRQQNIQKENYRQKKPYYQKNKQKIRYPDKNRKDLGKNQINHTNRRIRQPD